jgi:exosortase F-associated protein
MLQKILRNKIYILFSVLCVAALIVVRLVESTLFYDPFLSYYKSEYLQQPFPEFNAMKLFFHLLFRYGLNTVISLVLIYLIFRDKKMVQFAAVLYVLLGIVLLIAFYGVVYFFSTDNAMVLFYIRRFLIQPIFVLLFIPAFYYNSKMK